MPEASDARAMLPFRLIRVGGSLLDLTDLPARVGALIASHPPARNVCVIGGGPLVEHLRQWDASHQFSAEVCHEVAIRTMDLTARLFSAWARIPMTAEIAAVRQWRFSTDTIAFAPASFLLTAEPATEGEPLPVGWQVTSDSIAARLAVYLDGAELWLLKSAQPPCSDLSRLAAAGYVDAHLPAAAADLARVEFFNLRS